MIGVIANQSERGIVTEFFELFKTPWEFYRDGRDYEVVLCAGDNEFDGRAAKLVVVYSGKRLPSDSPGNAKSLGQRAAGRILFYGEFRLPIYGYGVSVEGEGSALLVDAESGLSAGHLKRSGKRAVARIGYDLFREIGALLTTGQPPRNADIPTLDLHIAVLRDLIVGSGVQLVEIPPVPEGYRFIACLTHDVDHPSIRLHRLDHTMYGFLYRAVVGSVFGVIRRRLSVRQLLANWAAALKLPFVYAGLAKDFWQDFVTYPRLEAGQRSSFFVIPFKGDPGRKGRDRAPEKRASGYGAKDIAEQIEALQSAGCEIGLHGIDAWRDVAKGREELEEIRRVAGIRDVGVRMHWLYFDEQSVRILEQAGADYDSTVGYNDAGGYRAGTTQVYQPFEAVRLLELPVHIMDTALFYPARLNLRPAEARKRASAIIEDAARFGGSVTINWHDRSIAPERCWRDFYVNLVAELQSKGAWFATAGETVAWFRRRRLATFDRVDGELDGPRAKTMAGGDDGLPALQLRVYNASEMQPQ